MRTYIFIYIFVFLSTVCLAQIDNNSTRSNSFGDLQLRRYSAGDTTWKRALVVGYDASNKDGLLYINYGGDFNLGTRISGPQLIIDGNLKFGSEYNQILFPEKLGYGGGITGDDGNYKRLTLFHGHSIALQTGSNNRNYLNTRLYINSLGNVGIGTTIPNEKLEVAGNTRITGRGLDVGYGNNDTNFIQIGNQRTTNGYAYIDFVGDATYTDYGLRIIRNNEGANTSSEIIHRGTGIFNFNATQAAPMTFRTSNTERIRIDSSGNVGIGTTTPDQKLTVQGSVNIGGTGNAVLRLRHIEGKHYQNANYDNLHINYFSGKDVVVGNFWNENIRKSNLFITGNVGIGTTSPSEKLSVNGNIRAKEVKVELENWPDYVFDSAYKLPSLQSVKAYISQNGHLPNIPNAATVIAEGIDLGDMNAKLLQKIEELTLYTLSQEEKLQTQQEIIASLSARLSQIESQINLHENTTP